MNIKSFILIALSIIVQSNALLAPRNQTQNCFDHHKACPIWQQDGECVTNQGFMWTHCKFSCGKCDAPCFDSAEECGEWVLQGKCEGESSAVDYCQKSCNNCGVDTFFSLKNDCVDQNKKCLEWSKRGECTSNPRWMLSNCAGSCNSCVFSPT